MTRNEEQRTRDDGWSVAEGRTEDKSVGCIYKEQIARKVAIVTGLRPPHRRDVSDYWV